MTTKELLKQYKADPWELIYLAIGNAYTEILNNAIPYFPNELHHDSEVELLVEKLWFLAENEQFDTLENIFNAPIYYGILSQAQRGVLVALSESHNKSSEGNNGSGWTSDNWSEMISALAALAGGAITTFGGGGYPAPGGGAPGGGDNGNSELAAQLGLIAKYALYGVGIIGGVWLTVTIIKSLSSSKG